ncbi:hypothetical protein [Methylovulum psychrotolerans]|uniref:Uncharacterized protein n=1 Tax=Methylovulum psychrotolerans TaxID=1704499 RepID=A0A2S5CFL4_9GAMM|nr:hypothetical protein [Methylovulum psychrotolerans]POZ49594.1 hypothetical protein AADEFJLK_04638 [Methylovulum psychrotolerans]
MKFTEPYLLWQSFSYCMIIAFIFGSLLGGVIAQNKLQSKINNLLAFRSMVIWGVLSLPLGWIWGWDYISAIDKLDCQQSEIMMWRAFSNTPIKIDIKDLTNVRLGMTSSRGDSWVVNLYVGSEEVLYSTSRMTRKEAQYFIENISSMKQNGCSK